MTDHYYAVIMAGGGGTRLWPLSRRVRPKQMLSLFDDRSLFQTALQRLEGVFSPEQILVVTVQEQAEDLYAQAPDIPHENFLIEPMPRGTASVVGFAAVVLKKRDPEAVMAVLTADHYIGNENGFKKILLSANDIAMDGYLVTLGIEPTIAATGFGYIQRGAIIDSSHGFDLYHVRQFTEKPDQETAGAMLIDGNYSWNSGMFIWRVDRILAEFSRQMPDLAGNLDQIQQDWNTPAQAETLARVWESILPETIDYGIMENAERVAVIPAAGLDWNDVGSWDSLFEVLDGDENGNNIIGGDHISMDTCQTLIYDTQGHRLLVTIGVEDLMVVDTGDVLMICHKDQSQRVRQVVDQLKQGDGSLL